MKSLLVFALILHGFVAYAGTPKEVQVPVEDIYSPVGFDTNDTSEVVITGWLPNLCHKNPMTKTTINGKNIDIKVTALHYHVSNPFCPEMIVPFTETVKLGLLDKGQYKITVNGKSVFEKKSSIKINEARSSAVDNHIYANVDYVDTQIDETKDVVALKGYNPSDCLVLDEVKFVSNKNNAYSVLPVMKQLRDFCPMKMVPFSYEVEVPKTLNKQKVLLHVRVMDGKSVNTIYQKK